MKIKTWLMTLASFTFSSTAILAQPMPPKPCPLCSVPLPRNTWMLDTDHRNPRFGTIGQKWASAVCNDAEWLRSAGTKYEWQPILEPTYAAESQPVAVSGIASDVHRSQAKENGDAKDGDVWFTHPFGNDFNFNVIWPRNANFDFLMAPRIKADAEQDSMRLQALNSGLPNAGVLHVETDSDFIPSSFAVRDGDHVAVFGRWIVDCGHDTFKSEIHPPLLLARASTPDGLATKSTLISRPYLVTQDYDHGSLREHLLWQIGRLPLLLTAPPPFDLVIASKQQLTARTKVLTTPFRGIQLLYYYVRPPVKQPRGQILRVSYGLTVRTGVQVSLYPVSDNTGTVVVGVFLDEAAYKPPALPEKKDWKVPLSDIKSHENLGPWITGAEVGAAALGNPGVSIVLENGVVTDRYLFPKVPEVNMVTVLASSLRSGKAVVAVDDSQPFPVRGAVDLDWVPDPRRTLQIKRGIPRAATQRVP